MDGRLLNGGIVLTGGGSQLKHLIQLTEYKTGLNARIGYPTEHLAAGHIEELSKPMYSTCIGLILKGLNVYENSQNGMKENKPELVEITEDVTVEKKEEVVKITVGRKPRSLKEFMDKIKVGLIDIFNEDVQDSKFSG